MAFRCIYLYAGFVSFSVSLSRTHDCPTEQIKNSIRSSVRKQRIDSLSLSIVSFLLIALSRCRQFSWAAMHAQVPMVANMPGSSARCIEQPDGGAR